MRQLKRGLAMLLAILLMLPTTPVVSFAEETTASDMVVYNLGSQEITVGYDAGQAEASPWNYKLFEENGNYTIKLEDNAFFPYEVQFISNGVTTVEWFETPDSTVQVGGHTFNVYSEQNDDTKLSQIGVWVGDDYIAARPESKTFTNPLVQPRSLLPLNVVRVSLDLSTYNRFQLKNVNVSAILSELNPTQDFTGDEKVVWTRLYYDNHEILEPSGTIDFSNIDSNSFSLELIVGSALQLDDSNTRYIVNVTNGSRLVAERASIYKSVEGVRSKVVPIRTSTYTSSSGSYDEYVYNYITKTDIAADTFYVGLTLNSAYTDYDTIRVYSGSFNSAEAAETAASNIPTIDVTDKLLNQDMTQDDTGLMINVQGNSTWYQQIFTFVFEENESKHIYRIAVSIATNNYPYVYNALYAYDSYSSIVSSASESWSNGVEIHSYTLKRGYSANETHYLRLRYAYGGIVSESNRNYVDKAVEGHFNTEAEAEVAEAVDIKEQLFPKNIGTAGSGYPANYSGDGQDFTIFAEGEVYKITVKAVDAPPITITTPVPYPGSSDTYFQVTGADELYQTYTLPYEHDTYYDMGYQTIFYMDDVAPSSLKPTFWKGDKVEVYSGHNGDAGTKQVNGETEADFSDGPVQYAAAAENGTSLKNYWVTFVPKHIGGAKLFVNGINGDEGVKREVFLTSINDSSDVHDIFIANVGDEELTGLTATLTDAKNIKLDPYWTVGGENNNTLAAFDSVEWTTSYSELANVAKIRLLPDGEGEIKGTLTITADDQETVVIALTGNAGNPKITTTEIPEAVKYVPYAVQIRHNNKYSWNAVTLKVTSGVLPEGVILKANGELYGVPKETGTFRFTAQMTNSDTRFGSSTMQYTLVVKDNSNANVNASTDAGYEISQRLGTAIGGEDYITEIKDYVFISKGEMDEFQDVWLNGEKLEKGVDYFEEDGSTKITVKSQTFQNKTNKNSTNTIAAEFRVEGNENKDLKKSAQNFKVGNPPPPIQDPDPVPESDPNKKPDNNSSEGNTTPSSTVSGSTIKPSIKTSNAGKTTATLSESDITKALKSATGKSGNKKVTIKFSAPKNSKSAEISIKKASCKAIADANVTLAIQNGSWTITLGSIAIDTINAKAKNDVKISVSDLTGSSKLTKAQKKAVNGRPVYDFTITSGSTTISDFKGGTVKVSVPYQSFKNEDSNAVVVYYLDAKGKLQTIQNSKYNVKSQTVTFYATHFSLYTIGYNLVEFTDVTKGYWAKNNLTYAAARNLLKGVSSKQFKPENSITRAEFVQMVINVMQPAAYKGTAAPFSDVKSGDSYYKAIADAKKAGYLTAFTSKTFGPQQPITREEMAAIVAAVCRKAKVTVPSGSVSLKNIYTDYNAMNKDRFEDIKLCYKLKIMRGTGDEYKPKDIVTRARAVTVQRRLLELFNKLK